MIPQLPFRSHLRTAADTAALAKALAPRLKAGDTLLLEGDLGAGKTHFARALIRARLNDPMADVPSPTFTLVQTYDAPGVEIWHADLYRLSGSGEVIEIGLAEAFDDAICLVEWPDRLGAAAPAGALTLHLALADDDGRTLTATGPASWAPRIADLFEGSDA